MTYGSETAAISRTPISVLEITLDFCSLNYGVGDCTATGSSGNKCYNTFPTSHDAPNYAKTTKTYRFSSIDAPLVSGQADVRPYIYRITELPTEIKNRFTVRSRTKIVMADEEEDNDSLQDPYSTERTAQGTFWKKLVARNPNYKGRPIARLEGYAGLDFGSYEQRFVGILDNIRFLPNGQVEIAVVSLLADLDKIETPVVIESRLAASITSGSSELTVTDASDLSASGYIRIEDEIIKYTTITVNVLSGLTRGAFVTTAATHDEDTDISNTRFFALQNPFVILQTLLSEGGIAAGNIDSTAFDLWDSFPHTDLDCSALILEPTTLADLFWELVDLLDIMVWQDENQKVTVRRNLPNDPAVSATAITDTANIISKSGRVDLNEKSRITRTVIHYDRDVLGDLDKIEDYRATTIVIDADAESVNEFNDTIKNELFHRWVSFSGDQTDAEVREYIELLAARRTMAKRDATSVITVSLERKDEGLFTGDDVALSTDELQDINGNDLSAAKFIVVRRQPKAGKLDVELQAVPGKKIGFIAPVDFSHDDEVAESQQVGGAGNLTLTASPVTISPARKVSITGQGDNSGITFTVTGKDADGGAQVSAATTGPAGDRVTIVDGGANDLYWSEVSQIAVSAAASQFVLAGIFLDYEKATSPDKEYSFISRADGKINDTTDGYYIY